MKHIMKIRRYAALAILSLQIIVCNGQSIGWSSMNFSQSVYDFGTIREQDGSVNHTFEFTNRGKQPFVIENVAVSCGCTTPTYSKAPIMPGKSGTIAITFDPSGRPGEFLKEIIITSNNRANRNIIKIKGTVTPRPRTIQDDYPIEFGSGVRASTLNLNYKYVGLGKSSSMSVALINTSPKSVSLAAKTDPATNSLRVAMASSLCAGCKGEATLTYSFATGAKWGMQSNSTYLMVNGVRQNIPISSTAIFVDDFASLDQQSLENAPKSKFSSQYYNFGDIAAGSKPTYDFTLTNVGDLPLTIRDVEPAEGLSVSLRANTIIAPQSTVIIKTTYDSSKLGYGRQFRSIVIITNDPLRPMREIRLAANIQ